MFNTHGAYMCNHSRYEEVVSNYDEVEEVKKCECGEEAEYLADFHEKEYSDNVYKDEHICTTCIKDLEEEFNFTNLEVL